MTTLGIKNRNPWNVKNNPAQPWQGSIGSDKRGHAIFEDEAYSARAATRTLARKYLNGKWTLLQIISSYAPVSDGNNPEEYALFLAAKVGVQLREKLHLFLRDGRVQRRSVLRMLLYWMAVFECGADYRPEMRVIDEGIALYEVSFCQE